ncbi:hypothetical protein OHAE_3430 [Ochrobactrum soli]|uniref:Uncharacterized protein n=1 Tax=Ochrobactrum soli TaxID=2448455 RepID=A0A2P9HHB7_9HYPH|nr:hypothetical protein OHAE_3430 [[Ochrobactrum] soli]
MCHRLGRFCSMIGRSADWLINTRCSSAYAVLANILLP